MAIRDNSVRLGAKIGKFLVFGGAQEGLSQHAENLNGERESNGFRKSLDVIDYIGTISDILGIWNEKRRQDAETIIKAPLQTLKAAQRAADAAEEAGEVGRKIPVAALRTPSRALDNGAETYLRSAAQPIAVMEDIKIQLRETNEKFDRIDHYLDVIGNIGTAAAVVELFDDYTGFISESDAAQALSVEEGFRRDSGAQTVADEPGEEEVNELVLPEEVAARLEIVYGIFDDRAAERSRLLDEAQQVMSALGDKAEALAPGAIEEFFDDLRTAVEALRDTFDNLTVLEDINALAAVSDALEGVAKVLNIALDAIQPVLDFFGPVVRLIEGVLDSIEKAIGLDRLEQIIKDAVQDQIDTLLQPILDELQAVLDKLDVDFFSILDEFFAEVIELRQRLEDLVTDPFAKVADGTERVLTGESIIVGGDAAETIRLALDRKFDDGQGGFAMAGAGDDTIRGTELVDLIYGGADDDTIIALGGDDMAFGGEGNDRILGGDGGDDLMGEAGDDEIEGGEGDDFIAGGEDDDILSGGDGNDRLEGEDGEDVLIAGPGDDILNGGDDADTLIASAGNNTLDGEGGLDLIRTFGEADAHHLILDPSAVLEGGAGRDHVSVGDAFAPGVAAVPGAAFDGGAGVDLFEVGGIDLRAAPEIANFEDLQILTRAGETSAVVADVDDFRAFDRLYLTGSGAVTMALSGGAFDLNVVFDDDPFRVDWTGLTPILNPLDGADAGVEGVPVSQLVPLTVALAEDVGTFSGLRATSLGMTVIGSDTGETIVDGGGSDIIRAGLGGDTVVLSTGDGGNRFNLDGAVGDVVLGTAADFDGDTIVGLTNRTDRLRIEGATAAEVTAQVVGDETHLTVQGASFIIDRAIEKLLIRDGEGYVEILENNMPPTAVNDDLTVDGVPGNSLDFDPTDNDFDIDAAEGVEVVLDDAEFDLLTGPQGLADGESIVTELGATLTRIGDELRYTPLPQEVRFRTYSEQDALDHPDQYIFFELGMEDEDFFDVTEDIPFFGFDSLTYRIRDAEGELSNTASIDFLVRPDRFTQFDVVGELSNAGGEQVATAAFSYGTVEISDELIVISGGGRTDRIRYDFDQNKTLATAIGGNDFLEITADATLGVSFERGSGNDVVIVTGTGGVGIDGGTNADWIEGGDGDDVLSGGGLGDVIIEPSLRLGLPATEETLRSLLPNILLSGGGDNILGASLEIDSQVLPGTDTRARDTVFHLDGDRDIVTGPIDVVGTPKLRPVSDLDRLTTTALALQNDTIRGFDTDDMVLMVFDTGTFGTGRTVTLDRPVQSRIREDRDALLLTDRDMAGDLGESVFDLLGNFPGDDANNLFPEIDFRAQFSYSFFIGAPAPIGGTYYDFYDDYSGSPLILQQAVQAETFAPDGGTNPMTLVTVSLKGFRMSDGGGDFPHSNSVLIEDPFLKAQIEGLDDPLLPREDLIDGAHLTFSMVFDGIYRDRFDLDIVNPGGSGGVIGNVTDYTFRGGEEDGYGYQYVGPETVSNNVVPALALRYKSAAPEGVEDSVSVRRGETVVFDVRDNDTDADGDDLTVAVFENVDPAFRDGNYSNGELVARIDPDTGRASGIFSFTAPDAIGAAQFTYELTDGEFTAANSATVTLDVTGLPPVAGDDLIVLPWSDAGRVLYTDLLANDSDPDGDPVGVASVLVDLTPGIFSDTPISVALTDAAIADLQAGTIGASGQGGARATFSYTLVDDPQVGSSGGLSDPAKVQVAMASQLLLASPGEQQVAEDESLTLDVLAGREGGFGAARIVSAGIADINGNILDDGRIEVSFDEGVLVVTPRQDLSGVTLPIAVEIEDALGARQITVFGLEITPVDDPIRLADNTGAPLGVIEAVEDETLVGTLRIIDVDSAEQPVPLSPEEIRTSNGGTLSLAPGGAPGLWSYSYTPGQDAFGADTAEIELITGEVFDLVFDVAPVEDAPAVAEPVEDQLIEVGGTAVINLFDSILDAEGNVTPDGIAAVSSSGAATAAVDGNGVLTLTGAQSGEGVVTYSATDATGLSTGDVTFAWRVNEAPQAVSDAVEMDASAGPILIRPIENDSDAEGPVAYVTGDDGTSVIIDPANLVEGEDAGGTLGTVVWSEAEGGFLYTAPDDPSFAGQRDVFFYRIEDGDGSTARGTVTIDLTYPSAPAQALRIVDPQDGGIDARSGAEQFLLSGEEDKLTGTAADLDGDEVFGLAPGDSIVVTDLDPAQVTVSVERLRDSLPQPLAFDFASPTLAALFGTTSLDALTQAFIGDTELTVTDGTASATLTLLGAFTGTFSVAAGPGGGTSLTYAPTAQGAGLLTGTEADDDLRGEGAAQVFGGGRDDVLSGSGTAIGLDADAGQDALIAGQGVASLAGGEGADLFILTRTGPDGVAPVTIVDFNPADGDRIALRLADYLDADDQTVRTDLLNLRAVDGGLLLEAKADPEDAASEDMVALALLRTPGTPPDLTPLNGTAARDLVRGTPADELINGLGGSDTHYGGGGADTFAFLADGVADRESIRDFEAGIDSIQLDTEFAVRFTSRYALITTGEDQIIVYGNATNETDLNISIVDDTVLT